MCQKEMVADAAFSSALLLPSMSPVGEEAAEERGSVCWKRVVDVVRLHV